MNLFELQEQTERRASYPAPTLEACAIYYRGLIERYHSAMMARDLKQATAIADHAADLCRYLYETQKDNRSCFNDWGRKLAAATAAPADMAPMWGQAGSYVLTVCGVPVRIEQDGLLGMCIAGFNIHVMEPLRPFFSETGFRSCLPGLNAANAAGKLPEEGHRAYLLRYFNEKKPHGMGGQLVMLTHNYQDRALGRELDRSEYDHQGNRKGSPEAAAEAIRWAKVQAKYADGAVSEEEEETEEEEDFPLEDDGPLVVCNDCETDLSLMDSYFETACGDFCPECMVSHRASCTEDHGDPEEESHLPGMAQVPAERADALADAEGERLTQALVTPAASITRRTGEMETFSPLFCESPANSQLSLF